MISLDRETLGYLVAVMFAVALLSTFIPLRTTISTTASTDLIAFEAALENRSVWEFKEVMLLTGYHGEKMTFTGSIEIQPGTEIRIQRIAFGDLRIRCKGKTPGGPIARVAPEGKETWVIDQRLVILVTDLDTRIRQGRTITLSFFGKADSVQIGGIVRDWSGEEIPLLRTGRVSLLGHAVFGLDKALYLGKSFELQTGDRVSLSGGDTASGVVTVNEQSAMTCSVLAVGRQALISRFGAKGFSADITFLDRIVHDAQIQILWGSALFVFGIFNYFKNKRSRST